MKYTSTSPLQTKKIGKEISQQLKGGEVVLLSGNLGAGKTELAKGIAIGLGITDNIVSPTFTLLQEYPVYNHQNIKRLAHIDTYRLENAEDLLAIGVIDYLGDPETVCLIEWPEKISSLLTHSAVWEVNLEQHTKDSRKIVLKQKKAS